MGNTWENTNKTVTLTNSQWCKLTTFLITSTNYRKRELEMWERLSKETNEDGTPKFPKAINNAEYLKQLESELEAIRKTIDNI